MSMCDRCIHGEVCGLEDNHEEALIYCKNMIPIDVFDTLKRMLDGLEQEPCDDAISKDAILDYVFHCKASLYDDIKEILDNIPSATPTRTQ